MLSRLACQGSPAFFNSISLALLTDLTLIALKVRITIFRPPPLFADFAEEGGDEVEQGGFVWKEGSDAGSAFEFLINAFDGVTCAHAAVVGGRKGKDSEALRNVFLHPCR